MTEPAALWSAKDVPKVWDPIEVLTKTKYKEKDIENIRKYIMDSLDEQMEGSKKDEDCIRSSDINRVMRLYDRLLLFNSLEAASEKGRDTYGKAEDENTDNKKLTGSLVVGDPNSYLVVYRLPIGTLKKKEGGMLRVFISIVEHQLCHLLIFYYRPKDVKNGDQHTALHTELMKKVFGHKTQPKYLLLDFTLEKSTKPIGDITGVIIADKDKSKPRGTTRTTRKSPEEAGGKTNKKPSPPRSPVKTSPKKKAAAKKKSAAKKKPSPVSRSPVKTRVSPKKKAAAKKKPSPPSSSESSTPPSSPPARKKSAAKKKKAAAVKKTTSGKTKVKSPKPSNTPKKSKGGKKFPKGLTLGPFRKEASVRGYDKDETKILWQQYKKGEI